MVALKIRKDPSAVGLRKLAKAEPDARVSRRTIKFPTQHVSIYQHH